MMVVLTVLSASDMFSLESFFIIAFVSFLAAVELTSPEVVVPSWRTRLRWFSLLGIVVLAGILIGRAVETLPESLVP